jgi:hypothetical protein
MLLDAGWRHPGLFDMGIITFMKKTSEVTSEV